MFAGRLSGDYELAKSVLHEFNRSVPGLMAIQLRLLGIERRQAITEALSNPEKGADFSELGAKYEKLLRDPKIPTRVVSFYALKFARFQAKVLPVRQKANSHRFLSSGLI